MADYSERVFDYITLFDDATINVNFSNNLSVGVNISDSAQIFNYFKTGTLSEAILVDVSHINLSEYIKVVHGDNVNIDDNVYIKAYYHDKVNDNVSFDDEVISHMNTPQDARDSFNIGTKAYVSVHYTADNSNDQVDFTDSVFAIISKHSTRRFKNAFFNLLGTTEEIIYTCSGKSSIIMNISMCNKILSDVNVDVILYKGGITPTYIMKGILVKPHQAYVINSNDETVMNLEDTDEIRVVTDTIDSSDIYIGLMEQL